VAGITEGVFAQRKCRVFCRYSDYRPAEV